ncbi:hypothetical protein [Microbulbifer sp. TYP-18]|uniref:hypothetical protein n=1 Tax=Microbulbifer sp. TYP-18 TaxID=3230024 RepID=UPI0034C67D9F
MKKKIFLLALVLLVSSLVQTEVVTTDMVTIERLFTYDDVGAIEGKEGTDIIAWIDTGIDECPAGV